MKERTTGLTIQKQSFCTSSNVNSIAKKISGFLPCVCVCLCNAIRCLFALSPFHPGVNCKVYQRKQIFVTPRPKTSLTFIIYSLTLEYAYKLVIIPLTVFHTIITFKPQRSKANYRKNSKHIFIEDLNVFGSLFCPPQANYFNRYYISKFYKLKAVYEFQSQLLKRSNFQ